MIWSLLNLGTYGRVGGVGFGVCGSPPAYATLKALLSGAKNNNRLSAANNPKGPNSKKHPEPIFTWDATVIPNYQ